MLTIKNNNFKESDNTPKFVFKSNIITTNKNNTAIAPT